MSKLQFPIFSNDILLLNKVGSPFWKKYSSVKRLSVLVEKKSAYKYFNLFLWCVEGVFFSGFCREEKQ